MKKYIDLIKFTLTSDMAQELLQFNILKTKLCTLKDEAEIKKVVNEMEHLKNSFIYKFQINNKKQIKEYLKILDESKKTY